jgi:hypothetical protein
MSMIRDVWSGKGGICRAKCDICGKDKIHSELSLEAGCPPDGWDSFLVGNILKFKCEECL